MIVQGNRPKSTQQNRRNKCPAISTRLLRFHYFEVNIVLWKEKVYQIRSPFMQFYSVYRDTCMYKNFRKSNHKQYIEIKGGFFVWDNIKNLGNILLLSNAKIRNPAFIEIYDWYQTKLARLLYYWVLIITGSITLVSCIITPTLIFLIKSIRPVSITVYNTKNSQPSIKSGDIFFKSSESNYQKAIKWHDF